MGLPRFAVVKTRNNGYLLEAASKSQDSHPLLTFNFYFDFFFNAAQDNIYFIYFIYFFYLFLLFHYFCLLLLFYLLKERGNFCGLFLFLCRPP